MDFLRANLGEIELEYRDLGAGEPVVLIHPGHFADWFLPLALQPVLADHFRLVFYHRIGCAGSSRPDGPVSMAQQAQHCRELMHHLGIARAHIVGHSSSGNVALQLAADSPDAVHSLAILEPALMSVPSAPTSRAFIGKAVAQYRSGDATGAIDTFLRGTCGPDFRPILDKALPDAFDQAVADAGTFFRTELPSLQSWTFNQQDASRITQPTLAAISAKSMEFDPIWSERQDLLLSWLPQAEPFVLPGATHLMQVQNPEDMAVALAAFFGKHPLQAS